jgi:hypothetical protein
MAGNEKRSNESIRGRFKQDGQDEQDKEIITLLLLSCLSC